MPPREIDISFTTVEGGDTARGKERYEGHRSQGTEVIRNKRCGRGRQRKREVDIEGVKGDRKAGKLAK